MDSQHGEAIWHSRKTSPFTVHILRSCFVVVIRHRHLVLVEILRVETFQNILEEIVYHRRCFMTVHAGARRYHRSHCRAVQDVLEPIAVDLITADRRVVYALAQADARKRATARAKIYYALDLEAQYKGSPILNGPPLIPEEGLPHGGIVEPRGGLLDNCPIKYPGLVHRADERHALPR